MIANPETPTFNCAVTMHAQGGTMTTQVYVDALIIQAAITKLLQSGVRSSEVGLSFKEIVCERDTHCDIIIKFSIETEDEEMSWLVPGLKSILVEAHTKSAHYTSTPFLMLTRVAGEAVESRSA